MNTTYLTACVQEQKTELGGTMHVNNNLTGLVATGLDVKRPIIHITSRGELPAIGSSTAFYVVDDEGAIYIFNESMLTYTCVGRDYKEITEINAGGV